MNDCGWGDGLIDVFIGYWVFGYWLFCVECD